MENNKATEKFELLQKKLAQAQKRGAVLNQKVKLLEEMIEDARLRENEARTRASDASSLMHELLARQRELNIMLHRSNTLLASVYEANKMLAVECKDAIQALPEPKKAEIEKTMSRIEELFKKTGIPDAEMSDVLSDRGEFSEKELNESSSWSDVDEYKPPYVEAEPVDDAYAAPRVEKKGEEEIRPPVLDDYLDEDYGVDGDSERKRKWWERFRLG